MRLLKIFAYTLLQDRRRERSKRFALLDSIVEDFLHLRAPRIDHNRSIAESTWPKLHPALKPANDQACGDVPGRTLRQFFVRVTLESQSALFQCRADLVV